MVEMTKNEKMARMIEETETEKSILIEQLKREREKREKAEEEAQVLRDKMEAIRREAQEEVNRAIEELTLTRRKLVRIVEILEELAERYDVGKAIMKSIIKKVL